MLRWGIIGCGDVVEKKSGPSIHATGQSRIMAVMRRDRAKAESYAAANDIPLATDNAAEVINHPDVDIVYVATPPSSHLEYVLAAAHAGKPVLCEKPMAMSADEGRIMIDACAEAGTPLFVAYYRRFHPHVLKMKELIEQGRIGAPLQAFIEMGMPVGARGREGFWRETPEISGGGMFVDVGSHRLDIIVSLLGEVKDAHGYTGFPDPAIRAEQTLSLCAEFESGAQLTCMADYISGRKCDHMRIIGTAGEIEANHIDTFRFVLRTKDGEEEFAFDEPRGTHYGLIRHIEDMLVGEQSNACSGHDGLQTEILLDAACRDAVRRRK
jgi:predicted dehydrogenase